MGSTELIVNLFRISQTEEKLQKDSIQGADAARLKVKAKKGTVMLNE